LPFLLFGNLCLKAQIIPIGRTVRWAPGLSARGGIPNRTTLINVKNSPYNAKGDGETDDTEAIQAALTAAQPNQVIYLPASTYLISNTLNITNANVSIRGDGPSSTIIKYNGGSGGVSIIQAVPWLTGFGSPLTIASACTQGVSTITLASASGISVGDILVISELNPSYATATGVDGVCTWSGADDYSGSGNDQSRLMTQVNRVTSISGDAVTLERPIFLTFPAANSPAAQDMTPTYGIGIENLQVYRTGTSTGGYNIDMETVAECWVENVASICAPGAECDAHVFLTNTYACEVRECWMQGGGVNGAGQDYGVDVAAVNSDTLFEDNIFIGMRHSMVIEGGGSGNVFGYNYAVGSYMGDYPAGLTEDIALHAGEPYMNLFEGNICCMVGFDDTWGGNAYNTAFRNWLWAYSSANTAPTSFRYAVDLEDNTYSPNIVGCVLGRPGDAASMDYNYGMGVQSTSYIHGNYSCITGSTLWDPTNSDHTVPASLYYPSIPGWWNTWGALRWPAIGPDLSPMTGGTPAVIRYNEHVL
jgi:hypothetical protein